MSKEDEILQALARHPHNLKLWNDFYDQIEPHLRLFALSLVRRSRTLDPSDAEDIVQDVLLAFLRNFKKTSSEFLSYNHVRNYLLKACRNRFLSRLQQTSVHLGYQEMLYLRFSDVSSEAFRRAFAEVENRVVVEKLIAALDGRCKEMASSYLLENKTLAEFAVEHGVKLGTIYGQWQACLETMRGMLSRAGKEGAI